VDEAPQAEANERKQMTKAIIYTRFSPRPDADTSLSCEKQEELCREYCEKQGYELVKTFADPDCSGDQANREGLWDAIAALRRGMVLVVRWRNRLAREVYLGEVIKRAVAKAGARIEAAEEDNGDKPEDRMIRGILANFAQYEKEITALRTKHAMLRHQANGLIMSKRLPYGQMADTDNEKRMVECEVEQETIDVIVGLVQKGLSHRGIAKDLDKRGRKPREAEKWSHKTIAKIIQREM